MTHRPSLLGLGLLLLAAGPARGAALPFTGTLTIQFPTAGSVTLAVSGAGFAGINGSGGLGALTSLAIQAGEFVGSSLTPVTDPGAAPIKGIQASVSNGSGTFAGAPFGGVMPVGGAVKICLFAACSIAPANLSVPLSLVGVGGAVYQPGAVGLTVIGAPWTTGSVVADIYPEPVTGMGFRHGPASGAESTAAASGAVRLVTPIVVSTAIAADEPVVGGIAVLSLHFVPEPHTAWLLIAGVGVLALGAARRAGRR